MTYLPKIITLLGEWCRPLAEMGAALNRAPRHSHNGGTRTGVAAAKREAERRRNIAKRRSGKGVR